MATKQQRDRDLKARQARAAAAAAKRKQAQRKRLAIGVSTAVLLVLGVSVFVSSGNGTKVASGTSTTVVSKAPPAVLKPVAPGATITGDTPCPKADGTSDRTTTFAKPPPNCLTPGKTYSAEFNTSKGKFTISLDTKAAPNTVNNFVVLARYHFYDGIPFHRVVPGFVIQGGDPLASGLGGPGYKFDDELPKAGSYKIGSVAMANSGPNTNGSQFFIIVGDAGTSLQPQFTLFGQVTEGMDIVKSIEAVGTAETSTDPNGGKPTQAIIISSITIKET